MDSSTEDIATEGAGAQVNRSTPLRRTRTPLRRTRFMHSSRKSKHARRERGHDFMGWTSQQPCMVGRFWRELHIEHVDTVASGEQHLECEGRIEVDHAGCRFTQGNGTRAFDWTCIPLCTKHHRMRTSWAGTLGQAGIFFGYSLEALRRWCDAAIAIHHALASRARVEVPAC